MDFGCLQGKQFHLARKNEIKTEEKEGVVREKSWPKESDGNSSRLGSQYESEGANNERLRDGHVTREGCD